MPFLDWVNKAQAQRAVADVPYYLLQFQSTHGDAAAENLLIQGDNLLALKALLPFYRGRVKCIYIDPPYNTQSAFEHYDDKLEHSQWLSMMWPRLVLLRELLADDGSIWVSIDDREAHYLKVLMDEVFGRDSFIASNVWQKRYSRENRESIGDVHEYLYVYSKRPDLFKQCRNLVPLTEQQAKVYRNPNNDPKGRWRPVPMTAQEGHATPDQFYEVVTPSGKVYRPPEGRCWGIAEATYKKLLAEGRIYFGKKGDAQPNVIRYLSEVPGALAHHLIADREFSLTALVRGKYLLAEAIRREIDRRRQGAVNSGFQKALPGFTAAPVLADSFRHAFTFRPNQYPARPPFYSGRYRFEKHYYPVIHDLREKRADGSPAEEFVCARAIDAHPAVKHWVRNVERDDRFSFWLPTATDYFYPDFVAELSDGRVLVVEYKGAHLLHDPDTREKDQIGRQWAASSGGKCLFLMAVANDSGRDVAVQIAEKIGVGVQ